MIRTVVCGMSGGVDSTVCAYILKRKGFNVIGAFMKNWDLTEEDGCTTEADRRDAISVCEQLRIPLHEVNFVKEYWTEVFSEMMNDYKAGTTPNPDILCNKKIKFGHFFDHVINKFNADAVATGHYAGNSWGTFLEHPNPEQGANLLKSADHRKDQTLFLSQISQQALQKTMFPVGGYTKDTVKKMALEAGFENIVKKKESVGICFIGKREFKDFILEYIEPNPGNFVDIETGNVVGEHKGIHLWTKGQRTHLAGLNIAYFIAKMCVDTNTIYVVKGTKHPALFSQYLSTSEPHWINEAPKEFLSTGSMECYFRYQHTSLPIPVHVKRGTNGLDIICSKALRAMAEGQYAVLYQGEVCLGSAKIQQVGPTLYELEMEQDTPRTVKESAEAT